MKKLNRVLADQLLSVLRETRSPSKLIQFLVSKEAELADALGMVYNLMARLSFGWRPDELEKVVRKWIKAMSEA